MALYDTIGVGYRERRRPDARIGDAVRRALGGSTSVVNVGAGAGSYEPRGPGVVAVEISSRMIAQRPADAARAVQADAVALPFFARTFDAAIAILTMHHWADAVAGLREMARVARDRVVVLTWDPAAPAFWLADYFPAILDVDRRIFLPTERFADALDDVIVEPVPIPHDCTDGFLGAYWRRPEAYLDAEVRRAISTFAAIDGVDDGVRALEADLASGAWARRHGALAARTALDLGYRLVTGRPRAR